MVIDAHIHLYAPEVSADPRAWGQARREPWWVNCVAPEGRSSLQGWATVEQLLRDMDSVGVDRVVLLGWYWENQATADLQNRWFADWTKAHPDRLSAFATVVPTPNSPWVDNVRRALDQGLCGIGELLPQAQGFTFKDESFATLMEIARGYRVPTTLHVTDSLSVSPGAYVIPTPLAGYVELVKDFPENIFILAHWGAGLPFYELNRTLSALFKNTYYDTSASALLYHPSVYRRVCDLIGADRILFGSDYPLLTHRRLTREPTFAHDLQDARASGLTEPELKQVLGENARRLLRLA